MFIAKNCVLFLSQLYFVEVSYVLSVFVQWYLDISHLLQDSEGPSMLVRELKRKLHHAIPISHPTRLLISRARSTNKSEL